MADSASARREARKRRLLLSSEERLKKIIQLNENAKGDTEEEKGVVETKTQPVIDIAVAVTASAPPVQSENAEEGERQSSLSTETTKEEISRSAPIENIQTKISSQRNETAETDHCEEATEERNPNLESKSESNVDVESPSSSVTDSRETSCPTQDINSDEQRETVTSSEQDNPILSSCSPSLHSPFPSNQTPHSHLPTKPLYHIPSRPPPSQNVPSSLLPSATSSSTTLPQTNTVQDTSRVALPAPTDRILTTREVFVAFVALLMRVMLATDWLTHFGTQSILIPFVAMQALFFSLNKGSKPTGGMLPNLLRMAAMFSNIPVASITKLQLIMSVLNDAMADLALYFFVFLVTHGVIEVVLAVGLILG
ncbi:uncharacterized protein [Asterias amurensis]|uniref:uncharacterized protein isoform X2 n=1 Tax=Asterias amurensis TaxID=7602 RepID=UPI003AB6ED02